MFNWQFILAGNFHVLHYTINVSRCSYVIVTTFVPLVYTSLPFVAVSGGLTHKATKKSDLHVYHSQTKTYFTDVASAKI